MIVEDVNATGMAEACPIARMDGYFTPPEALLGGDGRLSDTVNPAMVRGDASRTLAHAAVFKLAELGRLSEPGIDRARAGLLAHAVADPMAVALQPHHPAGAAPPAPCVPGSRLPAGRGT